MLGTILVAAIGYRIHFEYDRAALWDSYLPELESRAKATPSDGVAQAILAVRLIEAHENAAAATALRYALVAGERNEAVFEELAASTAATGETYLAIGDLRLGIEKIPQSPEIISALQRARELGQTPEPSALARAICPNGAEPLRRFYARDRKWDTILAWLTRQNPESTGFATRESWVSWQPENAVAQRLWALALVRNRRFAEAGDAFSKALQLSPDNPETHLAFAEALANGGLPSKAGPEYIAALMLRPDWVPALLGLGRNSIRGGLSNADRIFRRATKITPDSADAWAGLGSADLYQSNNLEEAKTAFETAARLAPTRTDFLPDFAETLKRLDHFSEAEALLRRRIRENPDDAQAHFRLGGLLLTSKPTKDGLAEAEAETRVALRYQPHTAVAESQLGSILLSVGRPIDAVPVLKAAVSDDRQSVTTLNVLAHAYSKLGDVRASKEMTTRSRGLFENQQRILVLEAEMKTDRSNPRYYGELAGLYRTVGSTQKAEQDETMLRLIKHDPTQVDRDLRAMRDSLDRALSGRRRAD